MGKEHLSKCLVNLLSLLAENLKAEISQGESLQGKEVSFCHSHRYQTGDRLLYGMSQALSHPVTVPGRPRRGIRQASGRKDDSIRPQLSPVFKNQTGDSARFSCLKHQIPDPAGKPDLDPRFPTEPCQGIGHIRSVI